MKNKQLARVAERLGISGVANATEEYRKGERSLANIFSCLCCKQRIETLCLERIENRFNPKIKFADTIQMMEKMKHEF